MYDAVLCDDVFTCLGLGNFLGKRDGGATGRVEYWRGCDKLKRLGEQCQITRFLGNTGPGFFVRWTRLKV